MIIRHGRRRASSVVFGITGQWLLKNSGNDANTWTSDSAITVGSGELLVVGALPRKTSNSDTNNVITSFTFNGTALDVRLNARQAGANKRGAIFGSGQIVGTGNVVLDLSGSAVQFEALQMFYWKLAGFNTTTPIPGAQEFLASASTTDNLTITRTGALLDSMCFGMWAVDNGDTVVTTADGIEDSNLSTGSGTQDFKGVFAHKAAATAGDLSMNATWTDQAAYGAILEVAKA